MKKLNIVITLLFIFFFSNAAMSQTRRYVKVTATGTGDGSSWVNASGNLQAMIDASAQNDAVWIAKGTYLPTKNIAYTAAHVPLTDPRFKSFDLSNGVNLYGGFVGNEVALSQRKAINKTILSGDFIGNDVGFTNNSENAYHVVFGANKTGAYMDGITVTGGNTTGMPQAFTNNSPWYSQITADGAGIYTYSCGMLIQNCVFINNNAAHYGGAVYAYDNGGAYNNCIFLNNHALDGAATYSETPGSNLYSHFVNCTMFNNSSNSAICKANIDNDTYMYNCIILGNTVTGLSAGSYYVLYSDVQNAFASGTRAGEGTVEANPFFTNAADIDGADNILGTADDGLIPQCGPAIGAGINGAATFTKDFNGGARIINGTIDMGVYETSLIGHITGIGIQLITNHNTFSEDLPPGLCQTKPATFTATSSGNGGTFQWKKNGVNVGTNSPSYTSSDYHKYDQVSLTYTNLAGCFPATIIQSNVIVLTNVSAALPVITSFHGPLNACPYINGDSVAYSINRDTNILVNHFYFGGGEPTITGAAIVNAIDTAVYIKFNSAFAGATLKMHSLNFCGITNDKILQIKAIIPQGAGTITGPTDACPYLPSAAHPTGFPATYTTRKVTDASSYAWAVPAEAIITGHPGGTGINDTIITVKYNSNFISGAVTAQAVNFCGAKTPRSLSVSKRTAATPGTITGPTDVCAFRQSPGNPAGTPVNYTIKKVLYATSYTWNVPVGASATHLMGAGIDDTIITVLYSGSFTGGAVTVQANSNCNTSVAKSLNITFKLPSTPGTITTSVATNCPQRRITYSLTALPSAAVSVQWTVPASGTIISGQGTLSLVVQFEGATSSTDTIRVVGVNGCGISVSQRKLKVAVLPACRAGNEETIPPANPFSKSNTILKEIATKDFDIVAMPNPSRQHFTLQLNGTGINAAIKMQVVDVAGRSIESKQDIGNNQIIIIGDNYRQGIYFVTFIQGDKKKILRLIKL